ncbi:MAG: hypothetical protein WA888_13115 [Burkholderiaceae bacterium]
MQQDLRLALDQLLRLSLNEWQSNATLQQNPDGWLLEHEHTVYTIQPAPSGLPFRWLIHDGTRRHTAASVTGLLSTIRARLDDTFEPATLRVGSQPTAKNS